MYDYFPQVRPSRFLVVVFLLTIIVPLIMIWFGSYQPGPGKSDSPWNSITYYIDPLFLHAVGVVLASTVIFVHLRVRHGRATFGDLTKMGVWAFSCPIILLLITASVSEFILKPSFGIARPVEHLPAPMLLSYLESGPAEGMADSCPSGFVVRQMSLFLVSLVFGLSLFEMSECDTHKRRIGMILIFLSLLAVVFVAFSRVYRGFHSVFDVSLSVSTCTFFIWLLYNLIAHILRRVPKETVGGLVSMCGVLFPIYFYYSQDSYHWVRLGILILCGLGLVQMFEPTADEKNEG